MPHNGAKGSKWIRPAKRLRIYERDGLRCGWCWREVTPKVDATLDHFLPQGSNLSHNVFTACVKCNSTRGDTPALEFATAIARSSSHRFVILDRIMSRLERTVERACLHTNSG